MADADGIALAEGESASPSVYDLIREEILEGRLAANERLKVADLAVRLGTSTNPVREALQQLRGEGFVLFEPNRGARVRPMDEDFVRDSFEVEMLIEPYLTRWFVGIVTERELDALEAIEAEIETLNFADPVAPFGARPALPPADLRPPLQPERRRDLVEAPPHPRRGRPPLPGFAEPAAIGGAGTPRPDRADPRAGRRRRRRAGQAARREFRQASGRAHARCRPTVTNAPLGRKAPRAALCESGRNARSSGPGRGYSMPALSSRTASVALAPIVVTGRGGSGCGRAKPA